MTCQSCGATLPENARFCLECGTPVVPTSERDIRKTVTMLFTDVTGSTALGEELDPEAYRAVMGRYFEVSRAAVERHGGTVEKFVGDAVLAVFGVPEVREDDALRAVRAAQDLNQAVSTLSGELDSSLGIRLEIRTGVNTGSVVAGASRAGGSFATGDAVNTAARLEQAAIPGEVLIGHTTYELVRDAVRVEETDPVTAKGKAEPVRAFRLLAVDEGAEGHRRRADLALIGRVRETRALDDALERTLETGRSHLVTVTGAPGIGKSRLVAEFLDRVGDRADVLRGRCVSYGQGITYWPVIQLLREACGLEGDESPEVARHALLQLMSGGADGSADVEVVDLLMPLLVRGGEPGGSDQTFWAVSRVMEQLALQRPLVITVDDLHWAEPTLLDLLDRVRDETRDLPLLLVCQARPDFMDEHPAWGQGSLNAITFGLEPFDEQQTAASLDSLLGAGIPARVVGAVTAWSGGNPLFVEEIAAHLVETGMLDRTEDGWRLTGDLAEAAVPPTVSALLAARLDRLPTLERELLERVSVLGVEFTAAQAELIAMTGDSGDGLRLLLANLARRDLLRRVRGGAPDMWAFAHVIVRDTAYETLPKSLRAQLHLRVADYLSQHESRAGGENLAFVAHHLGQASRYADLLAPHDSATRALADRAAAAYIDAAQDARLRDDEPGAAALLVDALDLEPATRVRRELLVMLQSVHDPQDDNGGRGTAVDLYAATMDDPDAPATELDRVHLRLHQLHRRIFAAEDVDPTEMVPLAERVIELAAASGDDRRQVLALDCLITVRGVAGRWESVGDLLTRIAEVGDRQDRRAAEHGRSLMYLVGPHPLSTLVDYATHEGARSRSPRERVAHQLMEAQGRAGRGDPGGRDLVDAAIASIAADWYAHLGVITTVATANLLAGDLAGGRDALAMTADLCRRTGDFTHGSGYLPWLALVELELGTDHAAVSRLVDEAETWTTSYDVMAVANVTAARAVLAARIRDLDAAAELARSSVEVIDRGDQTWQRADIRRWVSEVARLRSDAEEERRLLTEALELYAAKEIVTWNEQLEARLSELSVA